jgi:hypothetical protein
MHGLLGRQATVIGALAAAGLLLMQLRTEGIRGYGFPDILSILLVAVPIMARGSRAPRPPRGPDVDADAPVTADRSDAPDVGAPPVRGGVDGAGPGDSRVVERLLARGVAVLVAVGAWTGAVLFVLLQAWPPALASMIVMVVAASGIPSDADDAPVAPTADPGSRRPPQA